MDTLTVRLAQQLANWLPFSRAAQQAGLLDPPTSTAAPEQLAVTHERCRVETQEGGFKVLRCQQIREVFRCAADGQREIVEKTESTHIRPFEHTAATASSSGRYDRVLEGPMGPAVSATLGQMLDDFFQYAAELQQSLEQQDAAARRRWSPWGSSNRDANSSSSSSDAISGSSSSTDGSRLFSWWQRRRHHSTAAGDSSTAQPDMQQQLCTGAQQ